MDKSPDAFRTISEVAEEMDLPQHVLLFWETRFPQIKPLKRGGGRRYYRPDDLDLLRAVKQLLYGEGYTIKGVQKLLREQGASLVARGFVGRERTESTPKIAANPAADKSPTPRPAAEARPAAVQRGDVAALRAVLADLREADRLLSLARSG